jgi:hypothetical protein
MSSQNFHKGCSHVLVEILDPELAVANIRYYLPEERLLANKELNDTRVKAKTEHGHEPGRYALLPLDQKGNPLFPIGVGGR